MLREQQLESALQRAEGEAAAERQHRRIAEAEVERLTEALRKIRNGWSGSDPMDLVEIAREALNGKESP